MDWKGHHPGENFTTQGNLLDGPQVVDAMAEAYDPAEAHFGQRLLHCLQAGEAAGGDRRGLESAAMSIWQEGAAYGGGLDIGTDLRVDDHAAPITELGRLLDLHFLYFERPDPATLLPLEGALADEVTDALVAVGYPPDDHEASTAPSPRGRGSTTTRSARCPASSIRSCGRSCVSRPQLRSPATQAVSNRSVKAFSHAGLAGASSLASANGFSS